MKNNSSDLRESAKAVRQGMPCAKARRHEGAKARRHEGTNVEAHGVRLKARKPSALENAERPERTFKRDGTKAGNKTRMEQSTDQ
ncbi:MAG: hypothetical protein LBF89_00295 [Bacteroidales bacterium]|nr:hypothetical protein [Bacteroidales bacterium]